MNQKGFIPLIAIVVLFLVVGLGIYYSSNNSSKVTNQNTAKKEDVIPKSQGKLNPTEEPAINSNKIFPTPVNFSPKKGDKYNPINLPPPTSGYSKNHTLQSGPSYKVGSSCWTDKQILSVSDSNRLAFTCSTNPSGIDVSGANLPAFKVYQYCQIETGQVLIWRYSPQDGFSGSLQLVDQNGTIVGITSLPTLPKQYNPKIENVDPLVITKDNQVYLFVSTWGNRVANDSLKADLNSETSEILNPPIYINEGQKCP